MNSCFNCKYNDNCKHYNGLYPIDIDHTIVVCNDCGRVVFHGNKNKTDNFIKEHQKQPELF